MVQNERDFRTVPLILAYRHPHIWVCFIQQDTTLSFLEPNISGKVVLAKALYLHRFCLLMQYKPRDKSLGSLYMQGTLLAVSLQYRHYYYFNLIHRSWTPSSFRSNE